MISSVAAFCPGANPRSNKGIARNVEEISKRFEKNRRTKERARLDL
jgi:hypothetical protein